MHLDGCNHIRFMHPVVICHPLLGEPAWSGGYSNTNFYHAACFSMFPSVFILFVIVLFKKYKFLAQVREIKPLTSMKIIYSDIFNESRHYNQHCP